MEAAQAGRRPHIDIRLLKPMEAVGFAGAAVLFVSLSLPWFTTSETNPNSTLAGRSGGESVNAWQTFALLDYLLVAACVAPFILAYIIVRGHTLTWRPGEVTMIVGLVAFALILLNGVILGRPGDSVDISLSYGYLVALIGALLITAGGAIRQAQGVSGRKPPGSV